MFKKILITTCIPIQGRLLQCPRILHGFTATPTNQPIRHQSARNWSQIDGEALLYKARPGIGPLPTYRPRSKKLNIPRRNSDGVRLYVRVRSFSNQLQTLCNTMHAPFPDQKYQM